MSVTRKFVVLELLLDDGTLFLGESNITLGRDRIRAAVMAFGSITPSGASFSVESSAIPVPFENARWINRRATLLECEPDAGAVRAGVVLFSGIVGSEPALANGLLTVQLVPSVRPPVYLPAYGLISQEEYPQATDAAIGQLKPKIIGTVDECPLIPVQIQPNTQLAKTAQAGQTWLEVRDASTFASSGSVVVDTQTYTYTHRTDAVLLGMSITARHRAGTLVAQTGDNIYLAAGHAVASMGNIKGDGAILTAGEVDLAAATVTFDTPPRVESGAERFTLAAQFDAVAGGNTASNAANAINFVTGPSTQNASTKPSGVTGSASITFARPASGRIVAAVYAVNFTVTVGGGQQGDARIVIGNNLVWAWQQGTGVIYNAAASGPAYIEQDADADVLPVSVQTDAGGVNAVSVTITLASRTYYTGSLDDSDFATIAPGQALKVTQSDALPDRGRIANAKLHVRWFASDKNLGTATVKFDSATLGTLAMTPTNDGLTYSKTIEVDHVVPGTATLPAQSISTTVSGGTASLSHLATAQTANVTPKFSFQDNAVYANKKYIGAGLFPDMTGLQGNITVDLMLDILDPSRTEDLLDSIPPANQLPLEIAFYYQDGTPTGEKFGIYGKEVLTQNVSGTPTEYLQGGATFGGGQLVQLANSNLYRLVGTITKQPYSYKITIQPGYVCGTVTNISGTDYCTHYYLSIWAHVGEMKLTWNARRTESALTLANTPASGSTAHSLTTAKNMAVAGMETAISDGLVQFNIPAAPRVVDTLFDLASITQWSQLTNKTAEIALSGIGASVMVLLVELLIEYDELSYAPALNSLTATVTGSSGNPAEIALDMLTLAGETVEYESFNALKTLYDDLGITFARRVAERTEALQLLGFVLEQGLMLMGNANGARRLVQWFDESQRVWPVAVADLLEPAAIQWLERQETDITLQYRESYTGNTGFTRITQRNSANNAHCYHGEQEAARATAITIQAGFIRDDDAATWLADSLARLYARMRREVVLELPFVFSDMREGDLVDYENVWWRVTRLSSAGGWISLTAQELPR